MMIRNELRDGLLVPLAELELQSGNGYWLEIPQGERDLPRVGYFRDWLQAEIERSWGEDNLVSRQSDVLSFEDKIIAVQP